MSQKPSDISIDIITLRFARKSEFLTNSPREWTILHMKKERRNNDLRLASSSGAVQYSQFMATKKPVKKTVKTPAKKVVKKAAPKAPKKKTARKPNAGFLKPVQPDEALSAVVGSKPLPRTELTKKLWDYIKKNKLQDAKNRRNINADDKLKAVFNGKKTVSMFEMTKLVSKHLKA
ncbi:MAG: SWIB/MDM2 domain-containing protein [Chthoniobacterales bacterium]